MAATVQIQTPTTAPVTRSVNGRMRLTYPTRGYAVSRNPFVIWAILPLITLSFIGLGKRYLRIDVSLRKQMDRLVAALSDIANAA